MDQVQKNDYFGRKKTVVSYILAVLILCIHCAAFSNYEGFTESANFLTVICVFIRSVVANVAVPLFFIISGALFYRNFTPDKYLAKLKSRFFTLVIPYLIWNTVWLVFDLIMSYTPLNKFVSGRELTYLSPRSIFVGIFHYENNGAFWFVFALIVFTLISPLIYLLVKNKYVGYSAIAVLIVLAYFNIGLPESLFFSKFCPVYYLTGALIGKHYFKAFSTKQIGGPVRALSLLGIAVSLVNESLIKYLKLDFAKRIEPLVLIIFALSLWFAFDMVADHVKPRAFHTRSFMVYAMHVNICAIIGKLLYFVMPKSVAFAPVDYILTVILTLAVIEVFCLILKKLLPMVYSVVSGSR